MPLFISSSQIKGFAQSSTPSVTPEGTLWYDTVADLLKNSDGSTFNQVGKTSFAGAAVVTHDTTIGDYTTPSSATVSSPTLLADTFASYLTQVTADTSWPSSDTAKLRVNITNDNIDFNIVRDTTSDVIYYDLTAVSNSAWVLRFKLNSTTITADPIFFIGLSDLTSSNATSQDFIGCMLRPGDATNRIAAIDSDHDNANLTTRDASITYQMANSTTYYIEIIRTSTTAYTIKIFSDSAYTTQLGTTLTGVCAATVVSLRYIKFFNYSNDTTADTWTGTIDDVFFWNGVTVAGSSALDVFDNSTSTTWTSSSENNPNVYVDMGSALNLCSIAFYWNNTSTETEVKIQTSLDTVTWTDKRKITTSNLTNASYNFYRFNIAGGARYVRIYGTGTSKTLVISEIKILKKTDAEIFADLGLLEISSTSTSLTAAGT